MYMMKFELYPVIVHVTILLFIGFILKFKSWKLQNDWIPIILISVAFLNEFHHFPNIIEMIICTCICGFGTIGIHEFLKSIYKIFKKRIYKKRNINISHKWDNEPTNMHRRWDDPPPPPEEK